VTRERGLTRSTEGRRSRLGHGLGPHEHGVSFYEDGVGGNRTRVRQQLQRRRYARIRPFSALGGLARTGALRTTQPVTTLDLPTRAP